MCKKRSYSNIYIYLVRNQSKSNEGYRNQKVRYYCINAFDWIILETSKDNSRKLKFIHSELVIALIALEFLSSWVARDYFQLAFGPAIRTSSINCLPGHNL